MSDDFLSFVGQKCKHSLLVLCSKEGTLQRKVGGIRTNRIGRRKYFRTLCEWNTHIECIHRGSEFEVCLCVFVCASLFRESFVRNGFYVQPRERAGTFIVASFSRRHAAASVSRRMLDRLLCRHKMNNIYWDVLIYLYASVHVYACVSGFIQLPTPAAPDQQHRLDKEFTTRRLIEHK